MRMDLHKCFLDTKNTKVIKAMNIIILNFFLFHDFLKKKPKKSSENFISPLSANVQLR